MNLMKVLETKINFEKENKMRKVRYWDGFFNRTGVFHEWGI